MDRELWGTVWRSLTSQRLRALLTLLGIILGVGTLVVLSSAVEGMGVYMRRTLTEASGEDVISVSRKWFDQDTGKKAPPLNRFDARALERSERLDGSRVLHQYSTRAEFGERWGQAVWVVGTVPEALDFYMLELAQGRFLTAADVDNRVPVVILGASTVRKVLAPGTRPIGATIRLKGERFKVVGVLKKKPSLGRGGGFRTWDGSVIIPETAFLDRFAKTKDLREVVIRGTPSLLEERGLSGLAATAKAIVKWRHHGIQNFKVTDPAEQARSRELAQLVVGGLEAAIALVCLGVGGINIMNIMLVSVSQRTREIGIRRALGATREDIRRMFLLEALVLSATGGLLGVAGGAAVGWGLCQILTSTLGTWPFAFPVWQSLLGLVASVVIGALFGSYPARRAAELDPIVCLRNE